MRNSEAILAKGRFRPDVFKFSFFNGTVNLWNGLPVAMTTIDRVSLFSKKVNQFCISTFIVFDHVLSMLVFMYFAFYHS